MNAPLESLSFEHVAPELRLVCGADSLQGLARELQRRDLQRAVVLTGRSVGASAAMALLREALGARLVGELLEVVSNSPIDRVEAAARGLLQLEADAVIAVGGGSAAVTARAASIVAAEGRPVRALCTRRLADGRFESPRLEAPKLPQFVVATTPSTAFAKAGSALHDTVTSERLALFDPKTRAKMICLHPRFLDTAPGGLVLGASLNTLSTAIEALVSPRCDPISEAALMQALRLLGHGLRSPDGSGRRERLALAAVLCGRGTDHAGGGLASVLAHAIGHRVGVANGVLNAVLLGHVLRFNAVDIQGAAGRVAQALGAPFAGDGDAAVMACVAAFERVIEDLGVPSRLRDLGLADADLDAIAAAAMGDWFITRNPRRILDQQALRSVLAAAW